MTMSVEGRSDCLVKENPKCLDIISHTPTRLAKVEMYVAKRYKDIGAYKSKEVCTRFSVKP